MGSFANTIPDNKDILLAERMLISYVSSEVGSQNMLNQICTDYAPPQNVYILSEWYNYTTFKQYERLHMESVAKIIPDVIAYRVTEERQSILFISEKLKKYWY